MDKASFDATLKRLQEVNAQLTKLDPAIRSQAFTILEPYLTGTTSIHKQHHANDSAGHTPSSMGSAALVEEHGSDKPSNNVYLATAVIYQERGSGSFTTKEIKASLDNWGLIAPSRIDKTLQQAKFQGKTLFKNQGQNWSPTVSGESYMTKTYGVRKGKQS